MSSVRLLRHGALSAPPSPLNSTLHGFRRRGRCPTRVAPPGSSMLRCVATVKMGLPSVSTVAQAAPSPRPFSRAAPHPGALLPQQPATDAATRPRQPSTPCSKAALRCAPSATAQRSSLFPRRCGGCCGTRQLSTAQSGYHGPACAARVLAAAPRSCYSACLERHCGGSRLHLLVRALFSRCASALPSSLRCVLCATASVAAARLCAAAACVRRDEGAATPVFSSPLLD